jgi:hypothetical protein
MEAHRYNLKDNWEKEAWFAGLTAHLEPFPKK